MTKAQTLFLVDESPKCPPSVAILNLLQDFYHVQFFVKVMIISFVCSFIRRGATFVRRNIQWKIIYH